MNLLFLSWKEREGILFLVNDKVVFEDVIDMRWLWVLFSYDDLLWNSYGKVMKKFEDSIFLIYYSFDVIYVIESELVKLKEDMY